MDWVHLHLALNHVPVLGAPFVLFLLLWGWGRGSREILQLSLWLMLALATGAVAIKFTGDFAAEAVAQKPGFAKALVERHEESADQATAAVFVLGLAAALALVFLRGGRPMSKWSLALVAGAALATFGLMVRTANLGGHIRHPEIRPVTEVPHGQP